MEAILNAIKRRRRVARPLAAWHLLRHGAVIYGVHLKAPVLIEAGRRLLVSGNRVTR